MECGALHRFGCARTWWFALINGDTNFEGDESFSLNIIDVINATPGSLSGIGTIEEDDQQPTTTTITSNLPDPSVVGQPYTVSVSVSAQSLSPLGPRQARIRSLASALSGAAWPHQ